MRPLRSIAVLAACLAVVAFAASGCGNGSSSGGLGDSLSYVPADSPFVVAIDTDLDGEQWGALDSILNRFPAADTIKGLLKSQLSMGQEGVDFDKDIKPLLGNPAVISATDVGSFLSNADQAGFVAALQVKDKDALDSLIEKTGAKQDGEESGATVYTDQDTSFAVKDDVVVLAGSRELLVAALKRADGGDSLSEDDFDKGLEGLPTDALARVYVDVQGLLSQSEEARAARKIAWVGALRKLGLTITAHEAGGRRRLQPAHRRRDLTDDDLPLASGSDAAQVVQRPGEIAVGLRDPTQLVAFFENVTKMFVIKAEVSDPWGGNVRVQRSQDDVWRQAHCQKRSDLCLCKRERGGPGLIASGVITSAKVIANKREIARQTPRVSVTVRRIALARQGLGQSESFSRLERRSTRDRAQFQILSSGNEQDRWDLGSSGDGPPQILLTREFRHETWLKRR